LTLEKFNTSDDKYINIINIGESLDFVSINMLIHFVDQVKDKKSFIFELYDIDWKELLKNAISSDLLPNDPKEQY